MAVRGYLGRYAASLGILHDERGRLEVRTGPAARNPSYLALSPDGDVVYAVLETDGGGSVGAFAVDSDRLHPLGDRLTGGAGPCHVAVHAGYVLVANYGSGSVAVLAVQPDGSLAPRSDLVQHAGGGPHPERQAGPHAHMVVPEPSGQHILAVDLGTDAIYRYALDGGRLRADGTVHVPPGAGPRHIAYHPDGRFGYVANELDSTVSVLDLASFTIGATVSTVPDGMSAASYPSAIRVSADGRFCYVANRGPDTLAVLAVSPDGAELQLTHAAPTGGEHPRDFVLDGDRAYVANQHSGTVTALRVEPASGGLEPEGTVLSTTAPACLLLR